MAQQWSEQADDSIDCEQFAEDFSPDRTVSFERAGVLTSDEGFRFELPGGEIVYITVQVQ